MEGLQGTRVLDAPRRGGAGAVLRTLCGHRKRWSNVDHRECCKLLILLDVLVSPVGIEPTTS